MFSERCVLGNGYSMELQVPRPGQYRLALLKDGEPVVTSERYAFQSIEKLRYDFARDVEKALRTG